MNRNMGSNQCAMLVQDLKDRRRPGVAPLDWHRWVSAAIMVLIGFAMPWAQAGEPGRATQAAREQRDLQRQADLRAAAAAGTIAEDGWTLSGAVPLSFTSNAYGVRSKPQGDSYLGPWVQLNWHHTLSPRLKADVSLAYTEYRYQRFTDQDSSYAEIRGRIARSMTETQAYSSTIYSYLATYYQNDASHRFNDIEVNLSGGGDFILRLTNGGSVYISPQFWILQAMPNRPPGPKKEGRSYVSGGVTIGGTIPLSDQLAFTAYSSQSVTRYAQYAEETDFTQYLSAGLSRTLTQHLSLDLNGLYTLNLSTVASAQYQDLTVTIALNMSL